MNEVVPGFQYTSSYGMWAAVRMPPAILSRVNQALARTLGRPDAQERLRADGMESAHSTPDAFARVLEREIATWIKVAKAGNVKAD